MLFGAHCSTAGGVHTALQRARKIGGDICQIFVKNNMQWFGKPPSATDIALYNTALAETGIQAVFGHAGYLVNLGAPSSKNRDLSIRSLVQEIEFAAALDLPFLVMHPGAHLGAGEQAGISQIVAGLNQAVASTRNLPVRIALENTAGQGTCLGNKIAHLAAIFDKVNRPDRLGVCLDTAHLFAAGYNIRSAKGWDEAIDEVLTLIGLDQVLAFHLNDSKTDLGSRVDRHAHIGEGLIGRSAFRHIVNDPRFGKVPGCLETPKSKDLAEDVENLAVLRSLVRSQRSPRKSGEHPRLRAVNPKRIVVHGKALRSTGGSAGDRRPKRPVRN
ncbi:MAG TPA: deoxyribonuclease IV [Verrucomicrobiae bacterium]|jgi:deoxyribonuclease-4|nr:deoxyribonuclease IV [Verrucomicrobiae bacterium]